MKSICTEHINNFFKNITSTEEVSFSVLEECMVDTTRKVVNLSLKETLCATPKVLEELNRLFGHLHAKGYESQISEYEYDSYSILLNTPLNKSFLPKNIWFIHNDIFPYIQRNLESFVDTVAMKNIQKHAQLDEDITTLAKPPLVTVAITNYNYANYLEEAIRSVLDLNYPHIQRVIVDDASTDSSLEVIEKYSSYFEIIRHEKNSGQLAGFFSAMEQAKGEFIIFLDADDMLDFHAISVHLAVHIYSKPYASFTCARNRQMSASGSMLSDFHLDLQTNSEKIKYVRPRYIHTPTWSWSTTSAMMFRADMLRLIKTDNTDAFRVCADYYIVNFSNLLGASMLIDSVVSSYRRHGNNNFSKNFIIGGHKPTGHLKYHGHPEHRHLVDEIANKLINQRERFEPYFGNLAHYCTILSYVKPPNELLKIKDLSQDIADYLRTNSGKIGWELRKQKFKISFKMWYAKKSCFLKSLSSFKDFFNATYCEK